MGKATASMPGIGVGSPGGGRVAGIRVWIGVGATGNGAGDWQAVRASPKSPMMATSSRNRVFISVVSSLK
jgi:hypothetical protein